MAVGWRRGDVAERTALVYVSPLAGAVAVAPTPATLVLANAPAGLPARRATRPRPAEVLHTE